MENIILLCTKIEDEVDNANLKLLLLLLLLLVLPSLQQLLCNTDEEINPNANNGGKKKTTK